MTAAPRLSARHTSQLSTRARPIENGGTSSNSPRLKKNQSIASGPRETPRHSSRLRQSGSLHSKGSRRSTSNDSPTTRKGDCRYPLAMRRFISGAVASDGRVPCTTRTNTWRGSAPSQRFETCSYLRMTTMPSFIWYAATLSTRSGHCIPRLSLDTITVGFSETVKRTRSDNC